MDRPLIAINCDFEVGAVPFRNRTAVFMGYIESVLEAGGLPLLIPPTSPAEVLVEYAERADGFLFTGGHDYPAALYGQTLTSSDNTLQNEERTRTDVELMKLALASTKPLLGICAGMQLANVVCGGALIQDLPTAKTHKSISDEQDAGHLVTLQDGSHLRTIFGEELLKVNSAHHQAVDPNRLGDGLQISAVAEDGVIEGLELTEPGERFFELVQWHPERIAYEEHRQKIFDAFITACQK